MSNQFTMTFRLSKPITYSHNGETVEAQSLVLSAPTAKSRNEAAFLKQFMNRSIREMQASLTDAQREEAIAKAESKKSEIGESATEMTGDEIMQMVSMYSPDDINVAHENFKAMITSKPAKDSQLCMVDGAEAMTVPLYEQLLFGDIERLLGEYLARFLVSSPKAGSIGE